MKNEVFDLLIYFLNHFDLVIIPHLYCLNAF
jgi:hypothetical protein